VLRHRFDILLGVLTLLLLSAPLVGLFGPGLHPILARGTVTLVFAAMLISAVFAVSQRRITVIVALSLAVPAILLGGLNLFVDWHWSVIAAEVLDVCFLGYIVIVILRYLFAAERISLDTICASLCVYLVLGVLWSSVYCIVEALEPGSFAFSFAEDLPEDGQRGLMRLSGERAVFPLYYSFVTMTTLGYGDIAPISSAARMLSAIEAIMGQLYLAVLVARLVGLHISQGAAGRSSAEQA